MSEDPHAQANAEQVRMLREALMGTEPPQGEAQAPDSGGDPSPGPLPGPSPQTTS